MLSEFTKQLLLRFQRASVAYHQKPHDPDVVREYVVVREAFHAAPEPEFRRYADILDTGMGLKLADYSEDPGMFLERRYKELLMTEDTLLLMSLEVQQSAVVA